MGVWLVFQLGAENHFPRKQEIGAMLREGFGIRFAAGIIDSCFLQLLTAPLLVMLVKNMVQSIFLVMLIPCTDGHSITDSDEAMFRVKIAAGGITARLRFRINLTTTVLTAYM